MGSEVRCDRAWRERSWATRSEESLAAFTARVVGIVRRAEAKAAMASCSLEPWECCQFDSVVRMVLRQGTYDAGSPLLEVDVKSGLDGTATGDYSAGFKRALDGG
jgi:hypothetical protein